MSELINRELFSADMRDFQDRVDKWRNEAEDTETRARADAALVTLVETKLILDKQPTIDAVEVVRCGECKWCIGVGHYCKHFREKIKRTDGYCSYGERREG